MANELVATAPIKDRVVRLFSNPWFGGIAALCSVIGVPLSIYLFVSGSEHPDITYLVSPVRTSIVAKAHSSQLSVRYGSQPIEGDLSSVQVDIWNAGKKPILQQDVLEQPTVTVQGARIIDMKVIQSTRRITGLAIAPIPGHIDAAAVNWHILEHNDGGKIQLLYEGDLNVPVRFAGAVIGQSRMRLQNYLEDDTTPDRIIKPAPLAIAGGFVVLLSICCLWALPQFSSRISGRKHSLPSFYPIHIVNAIHTLRGPLRAMMVFSIILGVIMAGVALYEEIYMLPPFGL